MFHHSGRDQAITNCLPAAYRYWHHLPEPLPTSTSNVHDASYKAHAHLPLLTQISSFTIFVIHSVVTMALPLIISLKNLIKILES